MKQKRIILCILSFVSINLTTLYAQESVNSSGGDGAGSGGTVSYSIGQVVYSNVSAIDGIVNQGVQQPYEIFSVGLDDRLDIDIEMTVFPNPGTDIIQLRIAENDFQNLRYQLYDMNGKLLDDQLISNAGTSVRIGNFSNGSYFLKVMNENTYLKTFQIIKNK